MPNFCSAYACSNRSNSDFCRENKVSFHRFPLKNPNLLRVWLNKVRRLDFVPNAHSYLCSLHFEEDCFENDQFRGRKMLKPDAFPTIFNFTKENRKRKRTSYQVGQLESEQGNLDQDNGPKRIGMVNVNILSPSKDTSASMLEKSMNENFYLSKKLNIDSTPKTPEKKEDKRICCIRKKLMAKVMKRSLKKAVLESAIKAANAKKDFFETKKSFLSQTNIIMNKSETPLSLPDSKTFVDLQIQIMEEELASKIEERLLQKELFEAEIQAETSKRSYFAAKKSALPSLVKNNYLLFNIQK